MDPASAAPETAPPNRNNSAGGALSTDMDDPDAIPWFLWDDPMTGRELRLRLATASVPERARLLGKILREARDPEVWKFTTPHEVAEQWAGIARHLGRRRRFWEFLLGEWARQGRMVFHATR